jgi:thymidylate synthase
LIGRTGFDAPRVSLSPDVTDFYDFTTDDLIIEGYETGPQIKGIPIAV